MGKRRPIMMFTFHCVALALCATNILAKPRHVEQEHKFQSQSNGGVDVGALSGQYEHYNADLATWASNHQEEVRNMAEKLRSEYNSAQTGVPVTGQTYYSKSSSYSSGNQGGVKGGCLKKCQTLSPNVLVKFTGKSQEELDQITKDITMKIVNDMQSGKLVQSQISQPQWFERLAAQQLEILNNQNIQQQQYYHNTFTSSNAFHQGGGQNIFSGLNQNQFSTHDKLQQGHQQNVFHIPVGGSTNYYSNKQVYEHTQQQNPTVFVYNPTTTTIVKNEKQESHTSTGGGFQPLYNQYGQKQEQSSNKYEEVVQHVAPTVPIYTGSYYTGQEHQQQSQDSIYNRPITISGMQVTYTRRDDEREDTYNKPVFPAQTTTTTSQSSDKYVTNQQQHPIVYGYGNNERSQHQQKYEKNYTNTAYLPPPIVTNTVITRNYSHERHEASTQKPVVTSQLHSIYKNLMRGEHTQHNYRPIVVAGGGQRNYTTSTTTQQATQNYRPISYRPTVTMEQVDVQEINVEEQNSNPTTIVVVPTSATTSSGYNHTQTSQSNINYRPAYTGYVSNHYNRTYQGGQNSQNYVYPSRPYNQWSYNRTQTSQNTRPTYVGVKGGSHSTSHNSRIVESTHNQRPGYVVVGGGSQTSQNSQVVESTQNTRPGYVVVGGGTSHTNQNSRVETSETSRPGYVAIGGGSQTSQNSQIVESTQNTRPGYVVVGGGSSHTNQNSRVETSETSRPGYVAIGGGSQTSQNSQVVESTQNTRPGYVVVGGGSSSTNQNSRVIEQSHTSQPGYTVIGGGSQSSKNSQVVESSHNSRPGYVVVGGGSKTSQSGQSVESSHNTQPGYAIIGGGSHSSQTNEKVDTSQTSGGGAYIIGGGSQSSQTNQQVQSSQTTGGGGYIIGGGSESSRTSHASETEQTSGGGGYIIGGGSHSSQTNQQTEVSQTSGGGGYIIGGGSQSSKKSEVSEIEQTSGGGGYIIGGGSHSSQTNQQTEVSQTSGGGGYIIGGGSQSSKKSEVSEIEQTSGGGGYIIGGGSHSSQTNQQTEVSQTSGGGGYIIGGGGSSSQTTHITETSQTSGGSGGYIAGEKIIEEDQEIVNPDDDEDGEGKPPRTVINKNRGDQPPQFFEEDYESEEVLEKEPGIGFYPIGTNEDENINSPPKPVQSMNGEEHRIHGTQTLHTISTDRILSGNHQQTVDDGHSNRNVVVEGSSQTHSIGSQTNQEDNYRSSDGQYRGQYGGQSYTHEQSGSGESHREENYRSSGGQSHSHYGSGSHDRHLAEGSGHNTTGVLKTTYLFVNKGGMDKSLSKSERTEMLKTEIKHFMENIESDAKSQILTDANEGNIEKKLEFMLVHMQKLAIRLHELVGNDPEMKKIAEELVQTETENFKGKFRFRRDLTRQYRQGSYGGYSGQTQSHGYSGYTSHGYGYGGYGQGGYGHGGYGQNNYGHGGYGGHNQNPVGNFNQFEDENEDLTQQTQKEDFSQFAQELGGYEDLTQQTQKEDFSQFTVSQNHHKQSHGFSEQDDLTQHQTNTQGKLINLSGQNHQQHDLTQQTQKEDFSQFGQQTYGGSQKQYGVDETEDLTQQTQKEDFSQFSIGQHTTGSSHNQHAFDQSEDLTQQTQKEDFSQFGQHTVGGSHSQHTEDLTQQTQKVDFSHVGHHTISGAQHEFDQSEDLTQQTQKEDFSQFGQKTDDLTQQTQKEDFSQFGHTQVVGGSHRQGHGTSQQHETVDTVIGHHLTSGSHKFDQSEDLTQQTQKQTTLQSNTNNQGPILPYNAEYRLPSTQEREKQTQNNQFVSLSQILEKEKNLGTGRQNTGSSGYGSNYDLTQKTQHEDLTQQTQKEDFSHVGHHTISGAQHEFDQSEDLTQQTQKEDFSQFEHQSAGESHRNAQGSYKEGYNSGQQTEDLTQQFQTQIFGHHSTHRDSHNQHGFDQTEDLTQQTQKEDFSQFGQHTVSGSHSQHTEDLTQQTQNVGHHTISGAQHEFDQSEDLTQQTQKEDFSQFGHQSAGGSNRNAQGSYKEGHNSGQQTEDLTQQFQPKIFGHHSTHRDSHNQHGFDQTEDLTQQTQKEDFSQFGQHTVSGSHSQHTEDLTQQTQQVGHHTISGAQHEFDQSEDLTQQTQKEDFSQFGHQSAGGSLRNTQGSYREGHNSGQQTEDLTQQLQPKIFGHHSTHRDSHNQHGFDQSEDLTQQTQKEDFSQFGQHTVGGSHSQHTEDLTQQTQKEDLSQFGQHTIGGAQHGFDQSEDLTQQTQKEDLSEFGHQSTVGSNRNTQGTYRQGQNVGQQHTNFGQETQDLTQQTQKEDFSQFGQHTVGGGASSHGFDQSHDLTQQRQQNVFSEFDNSDEDKQKLTEVFSPFDQNALHNFDDHETAQVVEILRPTTTTTTTTTTTPKPGFWKRVGNKAKNIFSG